MALDGFIFDLDGTLIDSNGVHVEAWQRALEQFNYRVDRDRIFQEIGKGGDKVVPHLLGQRAEKEHGDQLRAAEAEKFRDMAESQGLRVFDGAIELIEALRKRGIHTAMATSSKDEQIESAERASGVKWRELFDVVTGATDAEQSKPSPDIISAALKKLKLSPAQCAMLGDTPFDAQGAKAAGVICLGVTCGGHAPGDLLRSGARAVYRDAADMLEHLEDALNIASPGPLHLTSEVMEVLMRAALHTAKQAIEAGEVPIGAVLADGRGHILASGFNELNRRDDATAHAEMVTFGRAAGKISLEARDAILVSTLEPCVMCLGAAMEAAVDTVIYGLRAPADSGTGRVQPPQSPESQMPRIVGDVLAEESRALFKGWLDRPGNNPQQVKFVRQLLSLTVD